MVRGGDPKGIDRATGATHTLTVDAEIGKLPGVSEQQSVFNQIIGVTVAIAVVVVALFFALITVERVALYGVLKAIGASSRTLFAGVVLQAVVVTLVAGAVGAASALALDAAGRRHPVHDIGRTAAGQRGVSAAGGRRGLHVLFATRAARRSRHRHRRYAVTSALDMDAVRKVYKSGGEEVVALDHADLAVGSDEIVALVGPSGSGKTTLCSIAGGILAPTSGRVVVGGDDISGYSARELTEFRREMVGFVFQTVNLVPFLTARENLLVVDEVGRRTGRAARRRADTLLEELGLADRANNLPGRCRAARSSGWRSAAR